MNSVFRKLAKVSMKTSLTIAACATTVFSQAQAGLPSYCEPAGVSATQKMKIVGRPNYFFRAFPEGEAVGYASDAGNFILSMVTGQQFLLPGEYDPVPVGEYVISVPSSEKGMSFYSVPEILMGNSSPAPLAKAPGLLGVYQSVGLMEKKGSEEIYGVIVAGDESTLFQKIRVSVSSQITVELLGQAMEICKGVDLKLPMLSKNAQEISGRDIKDGGATKIWKINHKTGACTEVENLGIQAGKADFSFNNRFLAFHLQADGTSGDVSYFKNPSGELSMNAYMYDRKTKRVSKISYVQPGENAYYPVFRKDGSVVYAILDATGQAWFAHVHPEKLKAKEFRLDGSGMENEVQGLLAVGLIWNNKCAPSYKLKTVESLLGAAMSLSSNNCQAMVDENWNQKTLNDLLQVEIHPSTNGRIKYDKDAIKILNTKDLEKACRFLN